MKKIYVHNKLNDFVNSKRDRNKLVLVRRNIKKYTIFYDAQILKVYEVEFS